LLICSDEWAAYVGLRANFDHRTVCHKDNEFSRIDLDLVLVSTNRIEGFWGNLKVDIRKKRGTRREKLDTYVQLRSWRTLKESIFNVVAASY
jgi:hypothetical protein